VSPPDGANRDDSTTTRHASTEVWEGSGRIGPYLLLRQLGEGGFGIVYLAEQTDPFRRRVALKVIKPGMDSRAVISRFAAERQTLAVMDHNGIARVYDAGTTEQGRPYFAMEYVQGVPITEYCDAKKLSIPKRLSLMASVCEAVHHAHLKGVIHRDLKPSNILVHEDDRGTAHPKIIDFGIAKALGDLTGGDPLVSREGHLVGTPEYMSPEQAGADPAGVDARSDVYGLGVVLYELLCGHRPFDLTGLTPLEIHKRLQEPRIERASQHITLDGETREVAERRSCRPQELRRMLRRELEWIPLKALRAERSERYRSAHELADDLRRYLSGEALIAAPERASYRLRKFMTRHWKAVAVVALVGVVLIGSTVVASLAYARAESRRQDLAVVCQEFSGKAVELARNGVLDEAGPLLEDLLEIQERVLGEHHADTLATLGNIAKAAKLRGDRLRAEEAYREQYVRANEEFGPSHPFTIVSAQGLSELLLDDAERLGDAESLARQTLAAIPDTLMAYRIRSETQLGRVLVLRGQTGEGRDHLSHAVAVARRKDPGSDRSNTLWERYSGDAELAWGELMLHTGREVDALEGIERMVDRYEVIQDSRLLDQDALRRALGVTGRLAGSDRLAQDASVRAAQAGERIERLRSRSD